MKILRLDLISFGKFNNCSLELQDNFNLIYGLNESGKTTISKFIEGVFYGFVKPYLKRTVFTEDYEKYRPWNGKSYEGSILVEKDGKNYVVYRNFKDKTFNIFNENTGKNEVELEGFNKDNLAFPGEYFFGMPLDIFKSTQFSNLRNIDIKNDNVSSIVDMLLNSTDQNNDSISFKKALLNLEKKKADIGTRQAKTKPLGILYQKKYDIEEEIRHIEKDKIEYEEILEKLNKSRDRHEKLLSNKQKLVRLNKKKDIEKVEEAKNYKMQILKDKANLLDNLSKIQYIEDIDENDVDFLDEQNKILNENRILFNDLSKKKKLISKDYYFLKSKLDNYQTVREFIYEINDLNIKKNSIGKLKLFAISIAIVIIASILAYVAFGNEGLMIAPILFAILCAITFLIVKIKKANINRQLKKITQKVSKLTNIMYENTDDIINDYRYNIEAEENLKYLNDLENKLQSIDSKLDDILLKDEESKQKINEILSNSKSLKRIDVEDYRRKRVEYDQLVKRIEDKDQQLKKISDEYDFSVFLDEIDDDAIKLEENEIKNLEVLNKEIDESIENNAKLFEKAKMLEKSVNLLLEKQELLDDVDKNIQKYEDEIQSIELAMDLINKSINRLHKNFIPRINQKVSEMMAYSVNKKNRFRVDDNLSVNIYDGVKFHDQRHLSSATFDLLSIFIRISVLEELMGMDYMMILDDCFVQLDDVRYKKCLDLLFKISNNNQIILFSCQRRDENLLNDLDIQYNKIELERI